jgi:hypothetical protein
MRRIIVAAAPSATRDDGDAPMAYSTKGVAAGVYRWLPEHDALILANYGELSAQQIGELVDRSRDAVIGRYHRLKKTPFPSNATRHSLKRDQAGQRKAKRIAQRDVKNAQIKRAIARGLSQRQIAKLMGLSTARVFRAVHADPRA